MAENILDYEGEKEITSVIEEMIKTTPKSKKHLAGRLTKSRCYLAGPIDHAVDDGVLWRQDFAKFLDSLGSVSLDPTNKPTSQCKYNEIGEEKNNIENLISLERWDELRILAKEIVLVDLRMVEVADFLVAYVDTAIPMCGTYDEIFTSLSHRKPTYVVLAGGKAKMPMWMRGKLNHNFVFDSFESLKKYLYALHMGVIDPDYTRWVFLDKV